MFKNYVIKDYDDVLASSSPTPGGGSALALIAAKACSLIQMAANITIKKFGDNKDMQPLTNGINTLNGYKERFYELSDMDAAAFGNILKAMKLPKTTEEEKCVRNTELQKLYRLSATVPLELMKLCKNAASIAYEMLPLTYEFVSSDCEIGIELLNCVIKSSVRNVTANTRLITDDNLRKKLENKAASLK